MWGSLLEVLQKSKKICSGISLHIFQVTGRFLFGFRELCVLCACSVSVWFLGNHSIQSLMQTFQRQNQLQRPVCWDRLPLCYIPQRKVKCTALNQRTQKLSWVEQLPEISRGFMCGGSCKNVNTCQVYLPRWQLCWNLLISPLQSALRFSDERQYRSLKDEELESVERSPAN